MPAIKCMSCKRYSLNEGCELERKNRYYDFRACSLDQKNFYVPENETEVNQDEL